MVIPTSLAGIGIAGVVGGEAVVSSEISADPSFSRVVDMGDDLLDAWLRTDVAFFDTSAVELSAPGVNGLPWTRRGRPRGRSLAAGIRP